MGKSTLVLTRPMNDSAAALDSFSIPHSSEGMEKLINRVAKCCADRQPALVAVESHQGLLIYAYALLEAGCLVPCNNRISEDVSKIVISCD